MKLLNTYTSEIRDFISDEDIPPYAILSHTWGIEEVTFRDWQNLQSTEISVKQGYKKIRFCCQQAVADNLEWVWIDTCCIDKSSSAELSEAINSMFSWYQKAAICYVYLVDVSISIESSEAESSFAHSRWFTRGWTLQELLAPTDIIFYSTDWKLLGKKTEILDVLSSITGIEEAFLQGRELQYASISKRMSWAAKRNTSRTEDIAYCLLGIFDINMPLIYGEGKKAFQRLQLELIKTNPYDHTLYAWGVIVDESSLILHPWEELPPWNESKSLRRLLGPLAESPRNFEFSGSFLPSPWTRNLYGAPRTGRPRLPAPVGSAIQFELPSISDISAYHWSQVKTTQIRKFRIATLFCLSTKNTTLHIGIPLQSWGSSCWGRTSEIILEDPSSNHPVTRFDEIEMMHVEAEQTMLLENGFIIFRRIKVPQFTFLPLLFNVTQWTSGEDVVSNTTSGDPFSFLFEAAKNGHSQLSSFRICFRRLPDETLLLGKLAIWVALSRDSVAENNTEVDHNGVPIFVRNSSVEKAIELESVLRADKSEYHHVMEPLVDSWIWDIEPFPKISIKVERKPIETGRDAGFVDVVDLNVMARDTTLILSDSEDLSDGKDLSDIEE